MKFRLEDIQKIFSKNISVNLITKKLISCNSETDDYLNKAIEYMKKRNFDVLGYKENNIVEQYITINREIKPIKPSDIVAETTPIIDVLYLMSKKKRLFVMRGNRIEGIVTRGDLQKAPVFLLFFGIITIFEIKCNQLIEKIHTQESWKKKLNNNSLKKAENFFEELIIKSEDITLLECLYLKDKFEILLKTQEFLDLLKTININSDESAESFLTEIREFRNNLAHPRDILIGTTWDLIINMIEKIEKLSKAIEKYIEI